MKIKSLLVILFLSFTFAYHGIAQTAPSAADLLSRAQTLAAAGNKNVMVIFHASWCVWCHKMDDAMNDPACKKMFTDNYVIVHLTVMERDDESKKLENAGAMELLQKYNGAAQGIPFWAIVDSKGNLLANSRMKNESESNPLAAGDGNVGCPVQENEVAYFTRVLKKTSKLQEAELNVIKQVFTAIQ